MLIELSLRGRRARGDVMETLLGDAIETRRRGGCGDLRGEAQKAMVWKIRENIAVAERAHGKALKHDVSVPVSRVANSWSVARAGRYR